MEERVENTSAIDSLESTLKSDFGNLRQQQQSRLEQLSSLMASLESCTQSATEEGESLNAIADAALGRLDSFKSDFGDADNKQQEFNTRIEELSAALENAEREKAALAEKVQSIGSTQEELNSAQSALGAKNETLETLQREFDALRQAHDQEHQELESLTEKAQADASTQEALEAARAELATRNEASETLQQEFDTLRQNHDQKHQELESARERANTAEEKLSRLENDSAARTEDAQQLQERIGTLEGEIEAKSSALQNAQESLESTQEDQNRVNTEFEALVNAQEQAEASQEGLKTELVAVQREMETLRDKYKEGLSTEAALALRQQVTETAEQVTQLNAALESTRKESKKSVLAQQLAEAIGEAEQASEENQALKQELALLRDGQALQSPEAQPEQTQLSPPKVARSPEDELLRIQEAAKSQPHGPKRVIGQILCDAEAITENQLEQALDLQKSNPHQHLGAILTELGFASEEAVAQARASQCGVEFMRITETTVDPDAASLISERLANQHSCIPISVSDRGMVLAVVNPMDLLAIEDVERFTNKKVDVIVATVPEIEHAIARYYWEPE